MAHGEKPPTDTMILDKKDYFSKKKWHGISKSGERVWRE
jgi:hypothetical protein